MLSTQVFYDLPTPALDGSTVVVFDGPNHNPTRFRTEQTLRAILFVVEGVLQQRDPDDPRITVIINAPNGTPFDLVGMRTLASTFSDYYPVVPFTSFIIILFFDGI